MAAGAESSDMVAASLSLGPHQRTLTGRLGGRDRFQCGFSRIPVARVTVRLIGGRAMSSRVGLFAVFCGALVPLPGEGPSGLVEGAEAWWGMATEIETTAAHEPSPGRAPVLVTRFGGQQRIFPVGAQVRVGRDPTLELVSVNPLVSRQCHGVITSDQGGATYVDQSRRGTFLDGKQVSGPLRITESVVLRLGDPATGEELGITPPLTS